MEERREYRIQISDRKDVDIVGDFHDVVVRMAADLAEGFSVMLVERVSCGPLMVMMAKDDEGDDDE